MSRFLIEVPHEAEESACIKAVRVFLQSGSHFLTNAEYGCKDGEHKAWIIVDVDSKAEAHNIVPPAYRETAKITQLHMFTVDDVDGIFEHHD